MKSFKVKNKIITNLKSVEKSKKSYFSEKTNGKGIKQTERNQFLSVRVSH